ncbi:MAG TPA: helix-turn-helix transcriptional regulator [Fimbriimonadaceae bacterium]|nr:helix-turn-helix transcriptional regulator [Fimbriimonadaceae bacterium]
MGEKPVRSLRTAEYDRLLQLLRDLRSQSGLTQKQLCERLGQEITYVSKVERGTRRIDAIELFDYIKALDRDPLSVLSEFWKGRAT